MRRQIAVVGGGLAGWSAALSFASRGFDTTILAPPAPEDRRTTALLGASVDHLRSIGAWPHLLPHVEPMTTMRLIDDTGRLIRAPNVEFRAGEIGRSEFGFNAENRHILGALRAAGEALGSRLEIREEGLASLGAAANGRIALELQGGSTLYADLVVGADGRRSPVREGAGIGFRAWSYQQQAIVLNFRHERPHQGCSTEFHTRTGPFTQVPLKGDRSSLVWVEEPRIAELVVDLPLARLSTMVEERLHSILGSVEVEEGVQTFPLSGGSVARLTAERVALVGEAAHVFPPIGAQGLNLGIRDGARLVEAAAAHRDDPGGRSALAAYEARARADIATRTTGVDLLNRSLLTDFLPLQAVRAAGLSALAGISPLRRLAMREGLFPGEGLRHLLKRGEARRGSTRGS